MTSADHLTLVSEARLRELLRKERDAETSRNEIIEECAQVIDDQAELTGLAYTKGLARRIRAMKSGLARPIKSK